MILRLAGYLTDVRKVSTSIRMY